MGLFRLWWVPDGDEPSRGAYVRYPSHDLLGILALESVRHGAVVVGEDLGTVAAGVREELSSRNILSYRLLWFEQHAPDTWPRSSMASITTHHLPTVVGLWPAVRSLRIEQAVANSSHASAATPIANATAIMNAPTATPQPFVRAVAVLDPIIA